MPQERFAGPEYFTEFDPERFAEQLVARAAQRKEDGAQEMADTDVQGSGREASKE